jgi:hypothetical protein
MQYAKSRRTILTKFTAWGVLTLTACEAREPVDGRPILPDSIAYSRPQVIAERFVDALGRGDKRAVARLITSDSALTIVRVLQTSAPRWFQGAARRAELTIAHSPPLITSDSLGQLTLFVFRFPCDPPPRISRVCRDSPEGIDMYVLLRLRDGRWLVHDFYSGLH